MKKFMMVFVAILSMQSAQAWHAARSFMSNPGVQSVLGASVATLPVYLGLENLTNALSNVEKTSGLHDVKNMLAFIASSPKVQQALGVYEPKTWYEKAFNYMNMADATIGSMLRWCGYLMTISQIVNAMNAASVNNEYVPQEHKAIEEQKAATSNLKCNTSRPLTLQEIEFLKKVRK